MKEKRYMSKKIFFIQHGTNEREKLRERERERTKQQKTQKKNEAESQIKNKLFQLQIPYIENNEMKQTLLILFFLDFHLTTKTWMQRNKCVFALKEKRVYFVALFFLVAL